MKKNKVGFALLPPDVFNGFRICKMPSSERKIFLAIAGLSMRGGLFYVQISLRRFEVMTGIKGRHIIRAINELMNNNMIIRTHFEGDKYPTYEIQDDVSGWGVQIEDIKGVSDPVKIPLDLITQWAKMDFDNETTWLFCLVYSKLWQFNKKSDWIANRQIYKYTRIRKPNANRAIGKLISMNVVAVKMIGSRQYFCSVNPAKWKNIKKGETVPKREREIDLSYYV